MRRSTALLLSGALILVAGTAVPTFAAEGDADPSVPVPVEETAAAPLDAPSAAPTDPPDAPGATTQSGASDEETQAPAPAPPPKAGPSDEEPAPATEPTATSREDGRAKPRSTAAKAQATTSVTIVDFQFEPKTATVAPGDTVTWTNRDSAPHTATDRGEFDTGRLDKGESGSVTFDDPGTYGYICTFHPEMRGTVVVSSSGGGSGSSGASGSADASSGEAGTAGTSGDGSTDGSASAGSRGDGSLPATGRNELPLVLLGSALLVLGMLVRAWDRYRAWR